MSDNAVTKLFDEAGLTRGPCQDDIRIANPKDVARIQLVRLAGDLGSVDWGSVPEDKRRRIAAILKEGGE